MDHQGQVLRAVVSDEVLKEIHAFYAGLSDEHRDSGLHGALFFKDHPELLEQLRREIDFEQWFPYHDAHFINSTAPPISWHFGIPTLAYLSEPRDNFSVWMPLVDVDEQSGGRLCILDTMESSIWAFSNLAQRAAKNAGFKAEFVESVLRERIGSARAESLRRGDALIFNSLNLHRAEAWRGNGVRETYVIRFAKRSNSFLFDRRKPHRISEIIRKNVESGRIVLSS